jgi:alkaline phosphatase/alkaline phosphatase D
MFSIDTAPGQHLNPDQWDGYQVERAEILEHLRDKGTKNIAVLTGDIHTFFAGTVTTTGNSAGVPVATEFVGGSATSLGIPETFDVPPTIFDAVRASNPHIAYSNFAERGYGILELGRDAATCEFKAVDARTPSSRSTSLAKFAVTDGQPGPQAS